MSGATVFQKRASVKKLMYFVQFAEVATVVPVHWIGLHKGDTMGKRAEEQNPTRAPHEPDAQALLPEGHLLMRGYPSWRVWFRVDA